MRYDRYGVVASELQEIHRTNALAGNIYRDGGEPVRSVNRTGLLSLVSADFSEWRVKHHCVVHYTNPAIPVVRRRAFD